MDESANGGAGLDELRTIVREIRERVRARHPQGDGPGNIPLANLAPLVYARDAAEGKVAAIGTVNPRAGGLANGLIQKAKRVVARALDWHIREQVEFNRAVVDCVQSTLEALNETNRAIAELAGRLERTHEPLLAETRELKDIRSHWIAWRAEWERNLSGVQIQFLRSLSDLQGAWQHRVTLLDETHRQQMGVMHAEYAGALAASGEQIQHKLWADLERMRTEYEGIIHAELRLVRQKTSLARQSADLAVAATAVPVPFAGVDWLKFGEKFRGTEDYVKRHLSLYATRFAGAGGVLDIGCGRGELLEIFQAAGIRATGIDLNEDCVAMSRAKGLTTEKADLFEYLRAQPDHSIGGITCLQVVEHLPSERLPEFIALAHAKLTREALLAIETPNPECLAIFARHFYLDPTHTRPIPPMLLGFYLEEAGFGRLETVRLEPALDTMPELASLPEDFRSAFFGALDYAIFGRKL